jgi:hypothetical protein
MDDLPNQLLVSERQIDRAIQLFLDEADFYSSATLAGAAEEILGCLLREKGREPALDNMISTVLKLLTPAEIDEITDARKIGPRRGISRELNLYRNWLKHYQPSQFELAIDAKDAAAELIDRALLNFVHLTEGQTIQMRRFIEWQQHRYSE